MDSNVGIKMAIAISHYHTKFLFIMIYYDFFIAHPNNAISLKT